MDRLTLTCGLLAALLRHQLKESVSRELTGGSTVILIDRSSFKYVLAASSLNVNQALGLNLRHFYCSRNVCFMHVHAGHIHAMRSPCRAGLCEARCTFTPSLTHRYIFETYLHQAPIYQYIFETYLHLAPPTSIYLRHIYT
jgi:hypothetical protein